jgi:hypothetical protein
MPSRVVWICASMMLPPADDLVPEHARAFFFGSAHHEVALVDERALHADVALEEHRDALGRDPAHDLSRRVDEPRAPSR